MSEEAKPHKEYHGDGTYTITTGWLAFIENSFLRFYFQSTGEKSE